jgi:hypothetical protein
MKPRSTLVLLAGLVLLIAACTGGSHRAPPHSLSASPTATTSPARTLGSGLPVNLFGFGRLPAVPLLGDAPAYAGPRTPQTLVGVRVPRSIHSTLTTEVRQRLSQHGFVIVPSDAKLMWQAYAEAPYSNWPVFVTTDVAYHQWHLTFDKVLRSLEQEVLLPKLERLTRALLAEARDQATELRGTSLSDAASRVLKLMQVEATLLGLPAGPLGPAVRAELALIRAHDGLHVSPILGFGGSGDPGTVVPGFIDYSLYTPRGHYTRTPELTRYFLGMSVLGQSAFLVATGDVRPFAMAVLASRLIVPAGLGSPSVASLWRDLYDPTAFLVGAADDYTPFEVSSAIEATTPGGMRTPQSLESENLLRARSALIAGRTVMVDPEAASVRLMGTRFVLDAYILDQLVDPNVPGRLIPSPLDLAAAFGSRFAYEVQDRAGQTQVAGYDRQLVRMRRLVAHRDQGDWSRSVYDGWLWSLEPSWAAHGDAYPDFMRTTSWTIKSHQTGFGSYAELRHDTILYVKQSSAEGELPNPPLRYRNWVEPDPVVYERLSAVTALMLEGLSGRHLLTGEQTSLLIDTRDLMDFFARIANDELSGRPLWTEDNARLWHIGDELEALWWRCSDATGPSGNVPTQDDDDAVIADIARGANDVLEIGTGRFDRILVLVPDSNGRFEIAVGGVYSYYEFTQPVSDRLTDEAWRDMLDHDAAPGRPTWELPVLSG